MANVQPLRRDDLPEYEELFATMEERAGFVPNAFLTMARRPALLDGLQSLLRAAFSGTVPLELKSLVALMTSYGAGCRYCQAHQGASLVHQGIAEDKLAAVAEFDRSEHFSPAERAAMHLALAAGQQPNAVTAAHFASLREHFDEGEIVEIVGVIGAFGFLNRWHETMATDLEELPASIAAEVLGPIDWAPGRHGGT
jgi:uncharacterized peroxidase-related enzyme